MMDAMPRTDAELTDAAAHLRFTTTRMFRLMRRHTGVGLSPSQLSALAAVNREGPLPVGALADEEQIAAPTATKVVDKLCRAGLVTRTTDPTDRRVSLVATTPAGTALLEDIRARRTAWLTTRLAELSDDQFATVMAAVDILHGFTTPDPAPHTPKAPA